MYTTHNSLPEEQRVKLIALLNRRLADSIDLMLQDAAIIEPGTFPTTISANRQVAADSERFALYQAALDGFTKPFYAENRSATPPDPQQVADAVARVIALPAGERPLHTVVASAAQRQAPQAVNDAVTQATQSLFEMLGIPLITIKPKREEK